MADRDLQAQEQTQEHEPDFDAYADMIMSDEEVREIIAGYEKQFGMTSEEFLRQWKAGTAPDTWETNSWAMLADYI